MRLYIWEGDGISNAYHDDGTLVVLAESPEQARDLTRAAAAAREVAYQAYVAGGFHQEDYPASVWDGTDEALNREPDRVVELDVPTVVAFNGGGYD